MPLKLRRRTRHDDLEAAITAQITLGRAVNLVLAQAIERIEAQDQEVTL